MHVTIFAGDYKWIPFGIVRPFESQLTVFDKERYQSGSLLITEHI
jgi:hypothetical protein